MVGRQQAWHSLLDLLAVTRRLLEQLDQSSSRRHNLDLGLTVLHDGADSAAEDGEDGEWPTPPSALTSGICGQRGSAS